MSSATHTCDLVIPGYTLTERIGSGGYAEVWRAEAPGGIEKAVKIVYGYCDDEFASQELKALERIKGVRHPFLLSLERFDVINGRLAILTELADMSLEQRLRQCRADGLNGIPRDELLRYMSDAAEALDFLSHRHSLLHLDIKPENLLVLGEHIKVADFGLVKELATRTQNSLVSGMTPMYAAPEIFDDEPSVHSDQYSLAIVYQEMLVGTLPFPGRTAAQLAKQHTLAEPQLTSVPVSDRAALAKALSKKPEDRFPSCKAFVDALLSRANIETTASTFQSSSPITTAPPQPIQAPDDTRPQSLYATQRVSESEKSEPVEVMVTQPVRRGQQPQAPLRVEDRSIPLPALNEATVDVDVPALDASLSAEQPTLYVAVGGVGIQALSRLRGLIAPTDQTADINRLVEFLALDTDRDELRTACSSKWGALSSDDTIHLPLRLPSGYDNSGELLGWLSRRWLYNIPRSLETRGYRPLGRLALLDNSRPVLSAIDKRLQSLAELIDVKIAAEAACEKTIKVVFLAGMGGGTGSGTVIDLANAVKKRAAAQNLSVETHGYLVFPNLANSNSTPLIAASTYSLLTELNHVALNGNVSTGEKSSLSDTYEASRSPFDHVYCVPGRTRSADAPATVVLDSLARYLALDRLPEARGILRSCRHASTKNEAPAGAFTLRSLGVASMSEHLRKLAENLSVDLAEAVKRHWITDDTSADWRRLIHEAQQTELLAAAAPADASANRSQLYSELDGARLLLLRGRFEECAALVFASECLQQMQRVASVRDRSGQPRLSLSDAKKIVDLARAIAASQLMKESRSPGGTQPTQANLPKSLVASASQRILMRVIGEFDPANHTRFLAKGVLDDIALDECRQLLNEFVSQSNGSSELAQLTNPSAVMSSLLERATPDLLQCGCDRRTIVFIPTGEAHAATVESLTPLRPQAAVQQTAVNDTLVITESSAISPRSLAIGLERVFPGITDAADRLHVRIDCQWSRLN
jgi:serine/threonine protein kinase